MFKHLLLQRPVENPDCFKAFFQQTALIKKIIVKFYINFEQNFNYLGVVFI
jgi:hypothetical protein